MIVIFIIFVVYVAFKALVRTYPIGDWISEFCTGFWDSFVLWRKDKREKRDDWRNE